MAFGSSDTQILNLVIEAQDNATDKIKAVGESLARLSEYVIGYEIVRGAIDGIKELGAGVIETNAVMQQLQQTFTAIYHSAGEAQQAVDWITQFGMTAPFTTQSIMQAGVAIASIGQDITQVLPALGNLAAVMNVDMPTAAQALVDAFEGRFQMMQRDLHVTKEELQAFGLQVEANGHVVQSTLIPALEAFVAKNYPQGMKLQMDTLTGVWSNFMDQFQLFEREVGKETFKILQNDLTGLVTWLQNNQGVVAGWADLLGTGLANAAQSFGNAMQDLSGMLPTILLVLEGGWTALSTVVDTASRVIHGAVADVADFLQKYVLPAVYQALGTLIGWWQQHSTDVEAILSAIWKNIQSFAQTAGTILLDFWGVIQGMAGFAWGAIELITGTALQNMDSNTKRWQAVQIDGWLQMQLSIVGIVNGLEKAILDLAYNPDIPNALLALARLVANLLIDVVMALPKAIGLMLNAVEAALNGFMAMVKGFNFTIPGPFGKSITIAPFQDAPQFTKDWTQLTNERTTALQSGADALLTPPAYTSADRAKQAAFIAQQNAIQDAQTASLDAAIMQANGYTRQSDGTWRRAGDAQSGPGFRYSSTQAEVVGQQAVDQLIAGWQKALNAKFSAIDASTKGLGPLPGPLGLPGYLGGGAAAGDTSAAKAAQDRALKDARDQFQIDLAASNFAAANKDIAAILKDMTPLLGFDAKDRQVENNTLLKEIAAAEKGTNAALSGAGASSPFSSYRLAQEAGYGQSLISFASVTAASAQQRLRQLETEVTLDRQIIANLTAQLAAKEQQTGMQQQAVQHAAKTATATTRLADAANKPATSLHQALRSGGVQLATR